MVLKVAPLSSPLIGMVVITKVSTSQAMRMRIGMKDLVTSVM